MTDRERWIYALPTSETRDHLTKILGAHGFAVSEIEAGGKVSKWTAEAEAAAFVVFDRDDLDVTLIEAQGSGVVTALGALLAKTGFYAQSALLESAFDVTTEDSRKALLTLAHMVVAWDEDWADLFLLHLASPDPIVRHDAVTALTVATLVARSKGPAPELLAEAAERETFPKLKETIEDARKCVAAIADEPS